MHAHSVELEGLDGSDLFYALMLYN